MPRSHFLSRRMILTLGCLLALSGAVYSVTSLDSQAARPDQDGYDRLLQVQMQAKAVDPIQDFPDLRTRPAGPERKEAFLERLVPIVEAENRRLEAARRWLAEVAERDEPLAPREKALLASLCDDYAFACDGGEQTVIDQLRKRIGPVPLALTVTQAIEESGWGTSRFARQGNNLFGLRCFSAGCGLAQSGGKNRYASFDSVQQAVRTYLRNLNVHDAYESLRQRREQLQRQGQPVTAEALIKTLDGYATRKDYRTVLLSLLRSNKELIESHRSDGVA